MIFAVIGLVAALVLVVALNWGRFNALGSQTVSRMLAAWTAIVVGLILLLTFLGY